MPNFTRLVKVNDDGKYYWNGKTVYHDFGDKKIGKDGFVYTLLENVFIYSIPNRNAYIIENDKGIKYTISPEAWDLMKEV